MSWNRADIAEVLEGAFGANWRKLAHPYLGCTSRAIRYWLAGRKAIQLQAVGMLRKRAEARLAELDDLEELDMQRCKDRAASRRAVTLRAITLSYHLQKEAVFTRRMVRADHRLAGYRETDLLHDDPF